MGRKTDGKAGLAAAGLGLGLLGRELLARSREADLHGQVVLITGGSRGLGYLLAREFAREGCRLVICARDGGELERARADVERQGTEILALTCDVADREAVERLVAEATARFGRIDILINNAGIIQVGPIQSMTLQDFEAAMDVMYWGVVYPTLAVLPQMQARRGGRIVNITSIGGKVSVPHLVPYSCAKFAAVGFSEGLRAELAGSGIGLTTIVPGLMRTGSHLNAYAKGQQEGEFVRFALAASLPLASMDAERAARQIVQATRRSEAERILSLPANLMARFQGLFPGATADLLGLVNRLLLPATDGAGTAAARGMEIEQRLCPSLLDRITGWGRSAARRFHEYPGPVGAVGNGRRTETTPR
jgi:NAD(P)-dependent dehydrogenase (short-subunit alcohol dehydrogenase family)